MRHLRSLVALFALTLLGACSADLDVTNPDGSRSTGPQVVAPSGAACTVAPDVAYLNASIDSLMKILTPNNSSAQSKWTTVKNALAANDPAAAQTALDGLLSFISLKAGQADTSGVLIKDPVTGLEISISAFQSNLFDGLTCYVELNSFDLNPNDPAKVFPNAVNTAAVYFPAGYVPQGYNVDITIPASLNTPFDQYPSYIDIKLLDANGDPPPAGTVFTGVPIVVVCFPDNISETLANRLLLGHEASDGFELLEKVEAIPSELAQAVTCGANLPIAMNPAERVLRKAAELLLPEKLYASFFAFGGVGGSPEEFSPFGAVDPNLSAFGGAGGSPEEFAPIMTGPTALTPVPNPENPALPANYTSGQVGTTATTGLPSVTVQTYGGDANGVNAIPGVKVTFTLGAASAYSPAGNAHFCEASGVIPTSVDVYTNLSGVAPLPCIDFGTLAGYSNLKAAVDGSSLELAGGQSLVTIVSLGSNPVNNEVNFLVQAVAGAATQLTLETAPSSTAKAGYAFATQPTVQLRDASGNEVLAPNVTITAELLTGDGDLVNATASTNTLGLATFSGLRIDGAVGVRTLQFTFGSLTEATTGDITITAGDAAALEMAQEPGGSAQAGVAISPGARIQIVDDWGNAVVQEGTTITASLASGLGTLAGTLTDATDADGIADFANLRIEGTTGDRTLKFAATDLGEVTSATIITISAGTATKLVMVTQPSSTASAGAAFAQQPSVRLRDAWNNNVAGPEVSVAAAITTGGAGTLAGTTPIQTVNGVATFTDLRIDGATGSRTLDFTSSALTPVTSNAVIVGAGAATTIMTYMPATSPSEAASYNYGSGAEAVAVSFAPRVRVTDQFGNPVSGATVTWSPLSAGNGATAVVGSGGTTSGTGLAQIGSWTLGQGTSTLNASIAGGASATFAATAGQVIIAACTASGSQKKADLAKYSSTVGGYLGSLTTKAVNAGLIRSAELAMSVTGQSSGPGGYPTSIRAYRTNGTLIASGNPYNASDLSNQTLLIPGDNGSPALIKFNLTPVAGAAVTVGEVIRFEVQVTAASNRTFQVWYNTKTTAGSTCAESKLVGTAIKGVNLSTRNYSY